MSPNKVELSDAQLDSVTGGVHIQNGYVENTDTGDKYKLKVDEMTAFLYINQFGMISEAERIQKLRDKGYID